MSRIWFVFLVIIFRKRRWEKRDVEKKKKKKKNTKKAEKEKKTGLSQASENKGKASLSRLTLALPAQVE